eukprot:2948248-Rhodomonas_salina.1
MHTSTSSSPSSTLSSLSPLPPSLPPSPSRSSRPSSPSLLRASHSPPRRLQRPSSGRPPAPALTACAQNVVDGIGVAPNGPVYVGPVMGHFKSWERLQAVYDAAVLELGGVLDVRSFPRFEDGRSAAEVF